ncbi:FAD:protein FMN transferase [Robertmurraya korlensis]|uniref:FAD:protein FMN transferase n=1 Tax=Robertmurraya korlensis TaxID=519977 RepID=UPI00203B5672|nr:FAD:protein FMN transferase [Robertmurraya korlensis]
MNSTIKLKGMNQALQNYLMNDFTTFERKASRFISENELDFINNSPLHVPVFLEETIADLFERSMQLSRKVDYYVNPFLGDAMKSIGYTASYTTDYSPVFKDSTSRGFVNEPYELLAKQWMIKNEDFFLDFGGFGKGYTVDRAKEYLLKEGLTEAIVNAGGDLAVIGTQQVGIEHPVITGKDMMRFFLTDLSMATSGKNYRKWSNGNQTIHHIVNGQNGQVATNNVLQATAIARTTMEAETISKLFCIVPFEQAKKIVFKKFPYTAYIVYFHNHQVTVGGDTTLFEKLEVSS